MNFKVPLELHVFSESIKSSIEEQDILVDFDKAVPDRDKDSGWLTLESDRRLGRLTVWTTGEAQLGLADIEHNMINEEFRQIESHDDLVASLKILKDWVLH